VHFWAEEDFEEECGRGEDSLEGTYQHKRCSREERWGCRVEMFQKWKSKAKHRRDLSTLHPSRHDR